MEPQRWPAEAIWQELYPLLPGFTVEILPEIDSTNSELMRRARAGRQEPILLVAEHQTAGRGRLGRGWQAAPGSALTFSFGLPLAPREWSGLSLVAGVAIAEALHPDLGLKWPNDLWWQDRKIGGILVETVGAGDADAERYVVVGAGLNIAQPPSPEDMRTPPAGLRELLPGVAATAVLQAVAPALVRGLLDFAVQGFASWQPRFEARDVLRGRAVVLSDGRRGTAASVDAEGVLRLATAEGWEAVRSAEVSVRPVA
ncbi:biotin--[acetyl-CoA-carboxylase] ligase [Xylophilus rhododendri]|uniref:Biotin--[acetyl-CoA-carboxylase] ligase n=1 Tax=Xylophilus rhododendri TaxID=2697032 RepID=A0A857J7B3_9BURK|nr:biotin--[acetyl-CoA-carboxylase] ligase [Xylophilus rhododendri]QHI98941.1 biotin--[acetyl-CoA-carboxylase] ligase [Xylophilus rhododendri]